MTKALVQNGAKRVYIAGRRLETLQTAAASLGANVIPVECDVTSQKSLQSAASFILADIGYLNLVVCNAGAGGPQTKPIDEETTLKEWADQNLAHDLSRYADTFTSNSASVWYTSMAFLELLDKGNKTGNLRQSSQIIMTTSTSGLYKKPPAGFAYSQSKAAAILAAKQLAIVLPKWNIRYVLSQPRLHGFFLCVTLTVLTPMKQSKRYLPGMYVIRIPFLGAMAWYEVSY